MTLVTSDGQKVSTSSAALRHAGSGWDISDLPEQPDGLIEPEQALRRSWAPEDLEFSDDTDG